MTEPTEFKRPLCAPGSIRRLILNSLYPNLERTTEEILGIVSTHLEAQGKKWAPADKSKNMSIRIAQLTKDGFLVRPDPASTRVPGTVHLSNPAIHLLNKFRAAHGDVAAVPEVRRRGRRVAPQEALKAKS